MTLVNIFFTKCRTTIPISIRFEYISEISHGYIHKLTPSFANIFYMDSAYLVLTYPFHMKYKAIIFFNNLIFEVYI